MYQRLSGFVFHRGTVLKDSREIHKIGYRNRDLRFFLDYEGYVFSEFRLRELLFYLPI